MSRAWERGRLARIAGRARTANPGRPGTPSHAGWLAGWLHQEARQVDARPEPVRRLHEAVKADEQRSLDAWVLGVDWEVV